MLQPKDTLYLMYIHFSIWPPLKGSVSQARIKCFSLRDSVTRIKLSFALCNYKSCLQCVNLLRSLTKDPSDVRFCKINFFIEEKFNTSTIGSVSNTFFLAIHKRLCLFLLVYIIVEKE